jgi:hypothetical protein
MSDSPVLTETAREVPYGSISESCVNGGPSGRYINGNSVGQVIGIGGGGKTVVEILEFR